MFFIWVLQLTALFHKAIWLCVYKREVRVGQEVLGIKQAGYTGQSVYVVYKKPHPPRGLKIWVHDPRPCKRLLQGRGLKRSTEVCNLRVIRFGGLYMGDCQGQRCVMSCTKSNL